MIIAFVVGFLAKWDEEQDKDQDEASPQRINLEQVFTFVKKVKVIILSSHFFYHVLVHEL